MRRHAHWQAGLRRRHADAPPYECRLRRGAQPLSGAPVDVA